MSAAASGHDAVARVVDVFEQLTPESVQQLGAIIRQKKFSQTAAAEICGVDQPKISKLLKGELYGFSTDQLLRFLTAFGQDVEIVVKTPTRRRPTKK